MPYCNAAKCKYKYLQDAARLDPKTKKYDFKEQFWICQRCNKRFCQKHYKTHMERSYCWMDPKTVAFKKKMRQQEQAIIKAHKAAQSIETIASEEKKFDQRI